MITKIEVYFFINSYSVFSSFALRSFFCSSLLLIQNHTQCILCYVLLCSGLKGSRGWAGGVNADANKWITALSIALRSSIAPLPTFHCEYPSVVVFSTFKGKWRKGRESKSPINKTTKDEHNTQNQVEYRGMRNKNKTKRKEEKR